MEPTLNETVIATVKAYAAGPAKACWIWQGLVSSTGYGRVIAGRKSSYAHRVSWEVFRGPIPPGKCVLHTCDQPRCINPSHLWLGTRAENTADMLSKNRQHGAGVRLTVAQVHEARALLRESTPLREVANTFGVNVETIRKLAKGQSWGHIK